MGVGEVIPRAIQPEIASKSKLRQTIGRDMGALARVALEYNIVFAVRLAFSRFVQSLHLAVA